VHLVAKKVEGAEAPAGGLCENLPQVEPGISFRNLLPLGMIAVYGKLQDFKDAGDRGNQRVLRRCLAKML
jgi:hypothetical protein